MPNTLQDLERALIEARRNANAGLIDYQDIIDEQMNRRRKDEMAYGLGAGIRAIMNRVGRDKRQARYDSVLQNALNTQVGVADLERQIAEQQALMQAADQQAQYWQERGDKDRARQLDHANDMELARLKNQRGPSTVVNTGSGPVDPYAAKRNEYAMDENQELYLRGGDARQQVPMYDYALKLLDSVETGPLTQQINQAKKYAQVFGFDVDIKDTADYESLAPIFGKLTMEKIQDTKGSVSNKEMEMFQRMNANYDYSTEGNRRLLQFAKSRAERDVGVRDLIRDMRRKGAAPYEISQAVDEYIQANDLSSMLPMTGLTIEGYQVEVE